MNENNYQMVIYYENDILVGVIYDNEKNIICKSNDISFWLRKYHNILNTIKDSSVLYINFSPILKRYKGLILKKNFGFYNEYKNVLIKEVDGISLQNCLDKLNQNIGLEILRIISKKKYERCLKK